MTTSAICFDRRRQAGVEAFTLIELSVAVFILLVLMAAAVPSFVRSFNASAVSAAARSLATSCQFARQEAVVYRKPTVLHLDLDKQLYWITQAADTNSPGSDADAQITLHTTQLSPRVTLASAQLGDEPLQQQGQMDVIFHPNGTCDALTVVFRGKERGSSIGLTVDPITTSATAYSVQ
jgi:prepilin-type N-terminal cleavage/methylation domain-containing protein